jgi:hypothetical protein
MSSNISNTLNVVRIRRLVEEVGRSFTPRNVEAEMAASHVATMRSMRYNMSEGCLRAVIYDHMAAGIRTPAIA